MTQAELQEQISQALRENQQMVAQMVQAEAAKGMFDPGTQAERVQKRNEALESELQEARHTLGMALQDRRGLRKFMQEFSLDISKRVAVVVNRVNKLLPGEEKE